ncbi:N-acetylglucosamine-6-phosphate deacetylase [Hoyosella altamirensis]|uniref:N-acetylglucosamine-6-phosphate deacetylase n=1 Tax=Hoyosella altamirensis TaxID=616997 RepID=A0A839RGY7_9ACTN|nr:amidohydrolase family protein [Hoyosella altamirensis]MBB3035992.1 N-acetylglucosamine-6-phosphate deacetylase [Hoyosella altamirensis]
MTALRGRIITGTEIIGDGVVEFEGDTITWVGHTRDFAGQATETGATLIPGFVDVHCHGGGGAGFTGDPTAARTAVRYHRARGTTTQLASLVSAPGEVLESQVQNLAPLVHAGDLAGIHLEGPFLSAAKCGAQDPAAIVPGDPALLSRVLDAGEGVVRSQTLAPETANFRQLTHLLRSHDAVPCLGHTSADAATTRAAMLSSPGMWCATHLFNAMPPLLHREPGPVAACLSAAAAGDMVVELIADGVHLAPDTVRMVFDLVGPSQIALVTDAMAAAGMADGDYMLGALDVRVDGGVARLREAEHCGADGKLPIAGGTASMIDILKHTVAAGVDLLSAVQAATVTPARLIGAYAGSIAARYPANIVALDDHLEPRSVWFRGQEIGTRTISGGPLPAPSHP